MIETKFKQTEIGLIPEEWELHKVSDGFSIIGNNTYSRDQLSNNGLVKNIHYGDILVKYGSVVDLEKENIPYINSLICVKPKHPLQDGDVIVADTAEDDTVGKASEIIGANGALVEAGLHTIVIRPKEAYKPKYLGYFINSSAYHNQLLPHIQGIKVSSISKRAVKSTYVLKPQKGE